MKKKVLILNDGSKYANWGIKACIDGLYHILDQTGTDLEVSSIDWTFMHKKYAFEPKIKGRKIFLDNNRIARRFFPLFHRIPTVADEFDYIADEWQAGRGGEGADEFIAKAKGQDLVIFNAEGSTYKNNIGALKGLFMLWFAKTRLGIKAAFMNGSVTLTRVDPVLPAMIRKVFSTIDIATVREPFSYEGILDFYPSLEQDVKMFPDSVFSLALEDQKLPETNFAGKDYFVVSRSMLPMDHRRPGRVVGFGQSHQSPPKAGAACGADGQRRRRPGIGQGRPRRGWIFCRSWLYLSSGCAGAQGCQIPDVWSLSSPDYVYPDGMSNDPDHYL